MFIYINITVIVSDTALIDLLMICQFTLYLSYFAWLTKSEQRNWHATAFHIQPQTLCH